MPSRSLHWSGLAYSAHYYICGRFLLVVAQVSHMPPYCTTKMDGIKLFCWRSIYKKSLTYKKIQCFFVKHTVQFIIYLLRINYLDIGLWLEILVLVVASTYVCACFNLLSWNFKTSFTKKYSCLFVIYTYLPEQNILPCVSLYNIYLFYYPSNHCRKIPKNLYEVLYLNTVQNII